ncbi:MAG: HNH endonuclease signature motif containing protein [Scytonema sp. PMC 1069.18]|nr:HNH endonuclease signature motif containing protein [Scytonema sp. PMC 1069.18]MEC4882461.1 HNH endonuclease signature motif containing protein [Scytonema sp. PMC 1070.18]
MPRSYINSELRHLVASRADELCEYCLIAEADRSSRYQVDHIISVKHGGTTTPDNLAYCCIFCNLQKGTDLGSINWRTRELVRFFNPRRDFWGEHFRLDKDDAVIQPLTEIGEVTVRIFDFNDNERVTERQALIAVDKYPSTSALQRMRK